MVSASIADARLHQPGRPPVADSAQELDGVAVACAWPVADGKRALSCHGFSSHHAFGAALWSQWPIRFAMGVQAFVRQWHAHGEHRRLASLRCSMCGGSGVKARTTIAVAAITFTGFLSTLCAEFS